MHNEDIWHAVLPHAAHGRLKQENPAALKVWQRMKSMGRCFGVADGDRTHDNRNHNPRVLMFFYVDSCSNETVKTFNSKKL
jgi:hypothetical protein